VTISPFKVKPKKTSVFITRVINHEPSCPEARETKNGALQYQIEEKRLVWACPSCKAQIFRNFTADQAEVIALINHRKGCLVEKPPIIVTAFGRICWQCRDCKRLAIKNPLYDKPI
jgi:hypothetical protein